MANAYIPPGVSVEEVVSPAFNAILGEQTSVCIVGPSEGFQSYQEVILLDDNDEYALSATFADLDTIVVRGTSDLTADPYTKSTSDSGGDNDFVINSSDRSSTGRVTVRRAMQTAIESGESVVVYHETSATPEQENGITQDVTLTGVASSAPTGLTSTTQSDTVHVQSAGAVPAEDYAISGEGTATVTITRDDAATVLRRLQTVWVDYEITSNAVYTITLSGGPDGGTFALMSNAETVSGLAYNVSGADLKAALVAGITSITADNLTVVRTGSGSAGSPYSYALTFVDDLAGTDVDTLTGTSSLTGGTSAGVTVTLTTQGGVTTAYADAEVQLDWDTTDQAVSLTAWSKNHVVKNRSGADADVAALPYTAGDNEDGDYMVDIAGADPRSIEIRRSKGSTSIGPDAGRGQVLISYQATPTEYWLPTRVYSQSDVEDKYGAAFGSDGSINSPLSFGALLAFENGAQSVVLQALFTQGSTEKRAPTGAVSDWSSTLQALRDIEDVNVIIPLLSSGNLTANDSLSLSIIQSVRSHIAYMRTVNQMIVAICGEDATLSGLGSPDVLRAHSEIIGTMTEGEAFKYLSPGSYQYPNPVTGQLMNIGGQYLACIVGGQVSGRPIQETMTRKSLGSVRGVNVSRTEREKNEDAAAGLTVIEQKNGVVRVRHSITAATAQPSSNVTQREFNVVRAKYYVIEEVRRILDTQVVGQIPADGNAAFTVQVLVSNVLEQLVSQGVIADYNPSTVQARRLANNPTHIEVRFTYQPSLPLNHIAVKFSLDTATGNITVEGV